MWKGSSNNIRGKAETGISAAYEKSSSTLQEVGEIWRCQDAASWPAGDKGREGWLELCEDYFHEGIDFMSVDWEGSYFSNIATSNKDINIDGYF